MNIPIGSLVRTKSTPISRVTDKGSYQYFFCETTEMSYKVQDGTYGLIINNSRISAVGNKIIDILFGERILSIADYTDQYGNNVWCEIMGNGDELL